MQHNFKKKFGQNFITDNNLLNLIIADAKIDNTKLVLEIGAGAGTLTEKLAQNAKKVISFEIDSELKKFLLPLEKKYDNLTVIFADFMKEDLSKFNLNEFCVVANLPYYITTAIIFKFLKIKPISMTLMVQKEVAQRLCANPKNREYGAMSVICQTVAKVNITRMVPRTMFIPMPEVDSAVINFEFNSEILTDDYINFVRHCFGAKRKTLINNLSLTFNITKQELSKILTELAIDVNARAEELSVCQFKKLFNTFYKPNRQNKL